MCRRRRRPAWRSLTTVFILIPVVVSVTNPDAPQAERAQRELQQPAQRPHRIDTRQRLQHDQKGISSAGLASNRAASSAM